ncbi:NAD-dependent epimerase/dehydratase family protein [Tenacibaculum bernardetii]|uniref:NAD-dependent epimerase/dehydratase family protein n=1 Tax=Tenacibaculum bernardetii TaxID=3021375 RepID=UPI0023B02295|nr:NAD-dependent epimerase/dehydratase family protein [Tenacibaculum bernardetii]
MNVSILGCGWLGKPLATYLISKEFIIKGSTTSVDKLPVFKEEGINPFLVDIDKVNEETIQPFLTSEILIVAIPSKNVLGFKNLIREIEKSTIKKVIFISSTSVYPSLNKEMTEEDATIDSPLVEIENAFRVNKNFKTTIIRFAGLFGYERQPGNWFQNKKVPQPKGFVNMIHQDDCVEIICQIIQQDVFGEVFNACSNHHPTRKEYYLNARKVLKKEPPVFDDSSPLKYKIINADKVQKRLNYTFIYDDLLA